MLFDLSTHNAIRLRYRINAQPLAITTFVNQIALHPFHYSYSDKHGEALG